MTKKYSYFILWMITFIPFNFCFSNPGLSKIGQKQFILADNHSCDSRSLDTDKFHAVENDRMDTVKMAELRGTVLSETGQPLEFVGVSLYRADSSFVQGALTDSLGIYRLVSIVPGTYYLKAAAVGFNPVSSALIKLEAGEVGTPSPLILTSSVTTLNTIQITGNVVLVQRKSDRFVIKVKESALATGTSIDLLKATPFVSLSSTNEVMLQGKKTLILVDNKPVPDASVESILQMIPAGNILSMELITNPSAKYDATYGAVINIITKKGQTDGYSGNVRLEGARGQYGQYGANGTITYTKGKLTVFGSAGYRKNDQMSFNKTQRVLDASGVSDVNQEEITRLFYQHFYSAQAGMEFNLNSNQTIGALITTNPIQRTGNFNSENKFSKLNAPVDSVLMTNSPLKGKGFTNNYNLNYRLQADSGKTELTMLATYTPYRSDFYQQFSSFVFSGKGDTTRIPTPYQTTNTTDVDIWIAQLDFSKHFKNQWKLETGLKNQIANSSSQIVYEENTNGSYVKVPAYSNNSKLNEMISAIYGILYKDWKKDKIQLGLRLENTNANYSGSSPQQYLKVFPTFFYQHDINEQYNLSFSYKKTISRTPYNEMVPYTIFVNKYTVFTGNPMLKPQYDDLLSLNVNLNKVNVSFNYASVKGMFGQFPSSQDFNTMVTYFALQNLDQSNDFYIDVFYPLTITSWWKTQNSGSVFGYSKSSGKVLGNEYSLSSTWYNLKTDHTFTFSKNIKLEVIAYYSSAYTSELTHIGVAGNIDASLLMTVLKNKGQIRIGGTDILKRNTYTSDQYFANYSSEKSRYGDSRRISIGFTYNFGKLSRQTPSKKLGNNEALDRIQ